MAPLVTNAGKAIITNRLKGAGSEPLNIQWGTGTTAEAATQTALVTPSDARVAGTSTQQTTTVTNDTYQVVGTLTAGGALAITEAGLFDAIGTGNPATGGNMFMRAVFSVINVATGDSIQFTLKVQFT